MRLQPAPAAPLQRRLRLACHVCGVLKQRGLQHMPMEELSSPYLRLQTNV